MKNLKDIELNLERGTNMQHVVTVAFDFDDKTIQKIVESGAEKKIVEEIKDMLLQKIYRSRHWGSRNIDPDNDPLSEWTESIIRDLFNENREEIMERAAKLVADSVKKSKYYKDGIADICKEVKK